MSTPKSELISIVIPSYQRGAILLETLDYLMTLSPAPAEIIVCDQTQYDEAASPFSELNERAMALEFRWERLVTPSIPGAMNHGLLRSKTDYVLFLDDDSLPVKDIISSYENFIGNHQALAVVGQVLQPGEVETDLPASYSAGQGINQDIKFPFHSNQTRRVANCIACNLLVNVPAAIKCGGFDLNFEKVAYRFETEFAQRLVRKMGSQLWFFPAARVNHLKVSSGGTRSTAASFLTSARPDHSTGDYYFALLMSKGWPRWRHILGRLLGFWKARFYLRKPWFLLPRLVGEVRGLFRAVVLYRKGQYLLSP